MAETETAIPTATDYALTDAIMEKLFGAEAATVGHFSRDEVAGLIQDARLAPDKDRAALKRWLMRLGFDGQYIEDRVRLGVEEDTRPEFLTLIPTPRPPLS